MPYADVNIRRQKAAERWEKWAELHPLESKARVREWQLRNNRYFLFKSAERRAKDRGIEFTLTRDDIPEIPTICPIAHIPIFRGPNGKVCDNSPTLDRIDPNKGYIRGNIAIISYRANRWKNNMTISDLESILKYMKESNEETI